MIKSLVEEKTKQKKKMKRKKTKSQIELNRRIKAKKQLDEALKNRPTGSDLLLDGTCRLMALQHAATK